MHIDIRIRPNRNPNETELGCGMDINHQIFSIHMAFWKNVRTFASSKCLEVHKRPENRQRQKIDL